MSKQEAAANAAKERPILFSGAMVRAILDGSKTQTRRVVKRPKTVPLDYVMNPRLLVQTFKTWWQKSDECRVGHSQDCPYGQPGDRLWVRESYRLRRESLNGALMDGVAPSMFCDSTRSFEADGDAPDWAGKLRPSIHMPRWASRILLEIVSVRVERLQDISQDDARAEGITDGGCVNCGEPEAKCNCDFPMPDYRDSYCHLWERINGAGSWEDNPWVWVVEFKRVLP